MNKEEKERINMRKIRKCMKKLVLLQTKEQQIATARQTISERTKIVQYQVIYQTTSSKPVINIAS